MADAGQYNIPARATRAYVAGFGSSSSLLAAAAALFLLGSAIVAFSGWPQIGARAATSNVAATPVAAASQASPRVIHALTVTRQRVVAAPGTTSGTHSGGRGAASREVAGRTVVRGAPATPVTGSPSTGSGASPGATAVNACSGCSDPGASPSTVGTVTHKVAQTVSPVTNKVAQTVSTVGTDVSQQITGLSGGAANQVSKVSPPVGSTVGAVGSTAGGVVSGTATTAANTIPGVGNPLGGGH